MSLNVLNWSHHHTEDTFNIKGYYSITRHQFVLKGTTTIDASKSSHYLYYDSEPTKAQIRDYTTSIRCVASANNAIGDNNE